MKPRHFRPEGLATRTLEPRALLSTVAVAVAPSRTITGTIRGTFNDLRVPDAGEHASLQGRGHVPGLGKATFTGSIQGLGLIATGHATGSTTITTKAGSISTSLIGPTQAGNGAGLPSHYTFTVSRATGKLTGATGTGTAVIVFHRAGAQSHGTFTLRFVATVG